MPPAMVPFPPTPLASAGRPPEKIRALHLRALFAQDLPARERLTAEAEASTDYSKNRITGRDPRPPCETGGRVGLRARIDAMFRGDKINVTEQRAVLHVALRAPQGASIYVDGGERRSSGPRRARPMAGFAARVRSGA